jgi:hypothetical protein
VRRDKAFQCLTHGKIVVYDRNHRRLDWIDSDLMDAIGRQGSSV